MARATYFKTVPEAASRYLRPAGGGTAFSYHQNASTQGPPTSSAVQRSSTVHHPSSIIHRSLLHDSGRSRVVFRRCPSRWLLIAPLSTLPSPLWLPTCARRLPSLFLNPPFCLERFPLRAGNIPFESLFHELLTFG